VDDFRFKKLEDYMEDGWPRGVMRPTIAGHCGKCGAPYCVDMTSVHHEKLPKFIPSCKCWNVGDTPR
jgi:hypothetical protein